MSRTPRSQTMPPPSPPPELQAVFHGRDLAAHPAQWDGLWKASCTPWDRGGPSAALADLLSERADLVPPAETEEAEGKKKGRKTALVPGCGRGYDALLLSALGYDVFGLDYSVDATRAAAEVERAVRSRVGRGDDDAYGGLYAGLLGGEGEGEGEVEGEGEGGARTGTVTWLNGDFFEDDFLRAAGRREFDLIFDYTFFCALPPSARPKWAARVSQLLRPDGGRLVCLEWPLHKAPSTGGPPWGLSAETYRAHLSRPGEEVAYGEDGRVVVPTADDGPAGLDSSAGALRCLGRIRPRRTHRAGVDGEGNVFDFISVWGHMDDRKQTNKGVDR